MHEQSTKPHTLAVGLGDSPAGLAAWLVEKLRCWTDCGGDVESVFTRDELLTWITAGTEWTIARCSFFSHNFSEGFLLEPVLAGAVELPVDGVPEPFVDVEDVADVAVAAFTEDGHAGRTYELTGPRLLTFAGAVGEIAAATGRTVRYTTVPAERWVADLAGLGVPDPLVQLLRYLVTEVLDGRNAYLADGVQRALGRPAAGLPRLRAARRRERCLAPLGSRRCP